MSRNILCRETFIYLHTTYRNYASHRQPGKFMNKVLNNTKKKRFGYHDPVVKISDTFSKHKSSKLTTNPKRVAVLNKLFMRNITDLMSTETYASQVLGLGIEINRVQVTSDFKILNVFWTSSNTEQDKVENILSKNAGLLRHELSQLRLMGNVPIIKFVKDKHYANLVELNKKLAIADYGDEGPSNIDPAAHLLSEFELALPIDNNLKEELAKLDEESNSEINDPELPVMTHCVFNLNHADIMNNIRKGQKKPRNLDVNDRLVDADWARFKLEQYSNTESIVLEKSKIQRGIFNKFLQDRQLIRKKYKESRYDDSVLDYTEESNEGERTFEIKEAEDFIIEDENKPISEKIE
ncbi:uncharacterized protein LOC130898716 [Diorhabda carinulata]|uniref:uncharacterized protein LOC130898716 n=1 Tax=Diorhabda carinulata TaxID=1163345 RepID=UPI0025A18262|nr:uncharacterized protein LOC130898716 [Diorhabda carinulata]